MRYLYDHIQIGALLFNIARVATGDPRWIPCRFYHVQAFATEENVTIAASNEIQPPKLQSAQQLRL